MPLSPPLDHVAAVRAFNRYYTNVIGVLRDGLLGTRFSLLEARVLFELGTAGPLETASVRRTLDVDAGYLSRVLARFERDGLVARERSGTDARKHVVRLTELGRREFAELDARSAAEVNGLLDRLSVADRGRLVDAMETIESILHGEPRDERAVLRAPVSGDYGWVVERHGTLYRDEYDWDERFEGLVAGILGRYIESRDEEREGGWIAELGGRRAGCIFCMKKSDDIAQLRLLLVERSARGAGVGTLLVDECIAFARGAGYRQMTLWTNDVLVDARRIYERKGFVLVEEERHHSFGHDLVGQNWSLQL